MTAYRALTTVCLGAALYAAFRGTLAFADGRTDPGIAYAVICLLCAVIYVQGADDAG